ncbi:MAG: bile acid:sodium symporter, partial [Planctomycetota bacterium]|nr:bile acid:sodium symporter [Planctomycetota bacterium]
EDRIAVLFGSSQKTLPIGVYLATSPEIGIAAMNPFAVFPMLMFHASQLFVDTIIAGRIAENAPGNAEQVSEKSPDDEAV